MNVDRLRTRRDEIIKELDGLCEMRRGSVIEQYKEAVGPAGEKIRRGPYPLYTYKEKGRTVSRRLKSREEVEAYRRQIEAFRRFEELTRELVRIGEQMCEMPGGEVEKKRRRSPLKPTRS